MPQACPKSIFCESGVHVWASKTMNGYFFLPIGWQAIPEATARQCMRVCQIYSTAGKKQWKAPRGHRSAFACFAGQIDRELTRLYKDCK